MDYLRVIKSAAALYILACTIYVQRLVSDTPFSWLLAYTCVLALAPVLVVAAAVFVFVAVMYSWSQIALPEKMAPHQSKFLVLNDKEMSQRYSGRTINMQEAIEAYTAQKMDFKHDLYTIFREHRHELFRFNFTAFHLRFVLQKLVPQAFNHSKSMDGGEVMPVYNRGNDFYNWFLGDTMVYTSGIYVDPNDSLAVAQRRKMDSLCQKLQLKPGEELLDIGCGWGSLVRHAAKEYGVKALGITICQEQVDWARKGIAADGIGDNCSVELMDYRDLPNKKYDKIVCVEMAEHVGVLRFQAFLQLVRNHLKDDGIFVLQIAGLRRAWQFEDLQWGVYMGTYVFPAADASCPLGWVTNQVESAGFEVWTTQNIGIHYSKTLKQWYDNWLSHRDAIVAKYGEWWFRQWCVFLAWSSIIASQGSSTCWQITMHKNEDSVDRNRYINRKCYGVVEE